MIRALPLVLGLTACLSAAAQEPGGDGGGVTGDESQALGPWVRVTGETGIDISPCGEALCAVNEWVRDPQSVEKPGDVLVLNLHRIAVDRFEGQAYDKRRDMTYEMTLSITPTGMHSEGCVLLGLICRSADWTRPDRKSS